MNEDDFALAWQRRMRPTQRQRQEALDIVAAETQERLRALQEREEYRRRQDMLLGARADEQPPPSFPEREPYQRTLSRQDMLLGTTLAQQQPPLSLQEREEYRRTLRRQEMLVGARSTGVARQQQRSSIDLYNEPVPLEDLQLALQMSASPRGRVARPERFSRQSFLPYGPSHLNALPSNVAQLPRSTKRKRESVLEGRAFGESLDRKPRAVEQPIFLLKHKANNHKKSRFPLPSLEERPEDEALNIPLASYGKLWEKAKGEVFRKLIHCNKVPIEKDTSVTGQFSAGKERDL